MNNISFCRAIKINTSHEVALDLSQEINKKDTTTPIGKYLNRIFDDLNFGKAKVYQLPNDEIYILTGKESTSIGNTIKTNQAQIAEKQKVLEAQRKRFVPEYKLDIYKKAIENLANRNINAVKNVIEDGTNGRKNSFIDVEYSQNDNNIVFEKLSYKSSQPSIEETIIYSLA